MIKTNIKRRLYITHYGSTKAIMTYDMFVDRMVDILAYHGKDKLPRARYYYNIMSEIQEYITDNMHGKFIDAVCSFIDITYGTNTSIPEVDIVFDTRDMTLAEAMTIIKEEKFENYGREYPTLQELQNIITNSEIKTTVQNIEISIMPTRKEDGTILGTYRFIITHDKNLPIFHVGYFSYKESKTSIDVELSHVVGKNYTVMVDGVVTNIKEIETSIGKDIANIFMRRLDKDKMNILEFKDEVNVNYLIVK